MSETTGLDITALMARASQAAAIFAQLDQGQTDRIVRAVFEAAFAHRVSLARQAHEETGMGKWQDKVLKNVAATLLVYEDIKDERTVGITSQDNERGITELAEPLGPILAVIPVTNPTSTTMFKILIALKTRNPIIIRPHRKAAQCSMEAARLCYEAALSEDAPEDCIQWVHDTSREETRAIMAHQDLALVLATGGGALVKAAYSSGKPALGVGAGNVPVYIERTAVVPFAVEQIIQSKTFDYGTVCASEQALVVEQAVAEQTISELKGRKAYFCSEAEVAQLSQIALDRDKGVMSTEVMGRAPAVIAQMAGFSVPDDTSLLMAPLGGVGDNYPLSSEILAPILAFYVADDFTHAANLCLDLNYHGGIGHTASIFSNDDHVIQEFALLMNAGRIVVNTPSSQGAIGGMCNALHPSLTLGCGTGGGNITTDNITARHLLNIQRIARRRQNERLERFDAALFYDETLDAATLERKYNENY